MSLTPERIYEICREHQMMRMLIRRSTEERGDNLGFYLRYITEVKDEEYEEEDC